MRTKRRALGQLLVCKGCCCGREDRGNPPLPEARLREVWKSDHLNSAIQLTVSGCLGPCDMPNVVQVIHPEGSEFLGQLSQPAQYEALIEWARACRDAGRLLPFPESLRHYRLEGFFKD